MPQMAHGIDTCCVQAHTVMGLLLKSGVSSYIGSNLFLQRICTNRMLFVDFLFSNMSHQQYVQVGIIGKQCNSSGSGKRADGIKVG